MQNRDIMTRKLEISNFQHPKSIEIGPLARYIRLQLKIGQNMSSDGIRYCSSDIGHVTTCETDVVPTT